MNAQTMLQVAGISKQHPAGSRDLEFRSWSRRGEQNTNPLPVLSDVSFSLSSGLTLAILGPNGCGKSTLLRILSGLDSPSAGSIQCPIPRPGPGIGYMTQGEALLPWRNVADNVRLPIEILGRSRADSEQQVRGYLESVGLSEFAEFMPSKISGGMRQRALLARLLAGEPRLLLLDEPFAELDLVSREVFCELLRSYIKEKNASAVVVTHSAEEALSVADILLIFSPRPGTVRQVFSFPEGTSTEERLRATPEVIAAMTRVMKGGLL